MIRFFLTWLPWLLALLCPHPQQHGPTWTCCHSHPGASQATGLAACRGPWGPPASAHIPLAPVLGWVRSQLWRAVGLCTPRTSLCLTGCPGGALLFVGEPLMAQKRGQPSCITKEGLNPHLPMAESSPGCKEGIWHPYSPSWKKENKGSAAPPCSSLWASHDDACKNHLIQGAK